MCVCVRVHVEVKGQLFRVSSPTPREPWGLKSDLMANAFTISLDVNLTLNIRQKLKELCRSGGEGVARPSESGCI